MFSRLKSAFETAATWTKNTLFSRNDAPKAPSSAPAPKIQEARAEVRSQVRDRLSGVVLDLPSAPYSQHARKSLANMPTKKSTGMFGIQTWAQESIMDPFQDFARDGRRDETPMTPMFYEALHQRFVDEGGKYYDPLYNLNHNLRTQPAQSTLSAPAPVLSKLTRMEAANTNQELPLNAIPFRQPERVARKPVSLADAWLDGDRAFKRAQAQTRDSVGQVMRRAA